MPDGSSPAFEPLRKSVTVDLQPAAAFRLFTEEIATWWPLRAYSISGPGATKCVIEPRQGGRVFEVREGGKKFSWGTVVVWGPPHRLVMSWHPGRPADMAQVVEVRFTGTKTGTLVELEHRGWEALGDDAEDVRDRYDAGWEEVLPEFSVAARRAS